MPWASHSLGNTFLGLVSKIWDWHYHHCHETNIKMREAFIKFIPPCKTMLDVLLKDDMLLKDEIALMITQHANLAEIVREVGESKQGQQDRINFNRRKDGVTHDIEQFYTAFNDEIKKQQIRQTHMDGEIRAATTPLSRESVLVMLESLNSVPPQRLSARSYLSHLVFNHAKKLIVGTALIAVELGYEGLTWLSVQLDDFCEDKIGIDISYAIRGTLLGGGALLIGGSMLGDGLSRLSLFSPKVKPMMADVRLEAGSIQDQEKKSLLEGSSSYNP